MNSPHTAHLVPLYSLNGAASASLISMLGAWFVEHDAITRDRLMQLAAESEAVTR